MSSCGEQKCQCEGCSASVTVAANALWTFASITGACTCGGSVEWARASRNQVLQDACCGSPQLARSVNRVFFRTLARSAIAKLKR